MNPELKNIIKAAFDLFKAGSAVVAKEDFVQSVLPKLYAITMDIPGIAAQAADLLPEIQALQKPENQADLVAFVIAEFAGVDTDAKAQAVLSAVLIAVEHVVSDVIAIKSALDS